MSCLPPIYPQQQSGSPQQQQSPTIEDLILNDQATYPNTPNNFGGNSHKSQCSPTKQKSTPRSSDSSRRSSNKKSVSRSRPQPLAPVGDAICGGNTIVPSLPTQFVPPAVGLTSPKVVEGATPKSQRRIRESFLQPNRGFNVTYASKGLYTLPASPTSHDQVKCWEVVATPRPDINRQNQMATVKAELAIRKQARVAEMLQKLELTRRQHLIHLSSLVNEAGVFQRGVLSNDNKHSATQPTDLMAMGAARLKMQGLPVEQHQHQRKTTFMLATQPKMWAFLLADISTLLTDLKNIAADEEPATPKFVADQIYSLNLFQQSNFRNAADQ